MSPDALKILVVDDEPDLRTLYELSLLREGYDVESASAVEEAWSLLQERSFQAVITDMRLPDGTGLELLRRLERAGRPERSIVITAYGSPENAVAALKAGAYDYLTKPVDLKQFRAVVAAAMGRHAPAKDSGRNPGRTDAAALPASTAADAALQRPMRRAGDGSALRRMAGSSPAMQQVRSLVDKVARSMAPVLIQGESGTGKELVARSIHQSSVRAGQPFIAVNCGAIPEQLLEAEFFGYRKGAFTGAAEDREGFFQAARGGTLFLDEIGDLPLSMQSKLLRAIQERAVRPVGAVSELPLDVRVISATHKDLAVEVKQGLFRQDLYYRLNVIEIRVPALRDRRADLADICLRVLERIAADTGLTHPPRLTAQALQHLSAYDFPGNVRELENLLHRAVALSGGPMIDVADLQLPASADVGRPADPPDDDPVRSPPRSAPLADPTVAERPEPQQVQPIPSPPPGVDEVPHDLVAYLDDLERQVLILALEKHRFNRTAAGAAMGLTLRQMRYRMARLGIHVDAGGVTVGEGGDAMDSGEGASL